MSQWNAPQSQLSKVAGDSLWILIRVVAEKRKVPRVSTIFQLFLKFDDEWELFEDVID